MLDLSIIIPTYNTSLPKLERAINSVVRCLKSVNYELLIIDDGSEVDYSTVQDKFKQFNLIFHRQEKSGVSIARNKGLIEAKGRYVTFLDSDDELEPTFLQKGIRMMDENNFDILIGGLVFRYKNSDVLKTITIDHLEYNKCTKKIIVNNLLMNYKSSGDLRDLKLGAVYGRIFSSRIAKQIVFEPKIFRFEDIVYNLHAVLSANSICVIRDTAYYYYQYRNSSIRKYNLQIIDNNYNIMNCLINNQQLSSYSSSLSVFYIFLYKDCIKTNIKNIIVNKKKRREFLNHVMILETMDLCNLSFNTNDLSLFTSTMFSLLNKKYYFCSRMLLLSNMILNYFTHFKLNNKYEYF